MSDQPRLTRAGWLRAVRRIGGPRAPRRQPAAPAPAAAAPTGVVETFTEREVVGWVAAPRKAFPVKVSLCVNGFPVQSTWADNPTDRMARGQVRGFHFEISELWQFTKLSDRLTVRVGGRPLPIAGQGVFRRPASNGVMSLDALKERLAQGYVFSHAGGLQLAKSLDTEWQASVIRMYHDVSRIVSERFGYDAFVVYGSLLGQVREGGFIGHDNDFDAAYVSDKTDGPSSAAEMKEVALALVDAGYDVKLMRTAIHVFDRERPKIRLDLFHVFFDQDDEIVFPFGVAGTATVTRADWTVLVEADMAGHLVRVPGCAEKVVELLYGPNWRVPIAGFHWEWARLRWDPSAFASEADRDEVARASEAARPSAGR